MRIEYNEGSYSVWETVRQENTKIYSSDESLEGVTRKNLTIIEGKLREDKKFEEADKIKKFLGKILRTKSIPQLIPTGDYKVTTRVSYLIESIDKYKEEYNLDLNPDFQRGDVWSDEQRVAYVEFLMQGGKSNPIYFNQSGWMRDFQGEMVIVDGKQRLKSLLLFLNNKLPIFKDLDEEGKGFYSKDFDYIACDIEIVVNNLPTKAQVLEWYLQMNKGNIAHTKEELARVEGLLEIEKKK